MPVDILLPMILLPLLIVGGLTWYRQAIRRLEPDATRRAISGMRLTSEHLRRLPSPPMRVIYEIGDDRLADVDHVVIGPQGVIAITTVLADRPDGEIAADPALLAGAAVTRAEVSELTEPAGTRCDVLAKVFWGAPHGDGPVAREITAGTVGVLGQQLGEWLSSLPADVLTAAQVDDTWRAVTTGIGRPDPLA